MKLKDEEDALALELAPREYQVKETDRRTSAPF